MSVPPANGPAAGVTDVTEGARIGPGPVGGVLPQVTANSAITRIATRYTASGSAQLGAALLERDENYTFKLHIRKEIGLQLAPRGAKMRHTDFTEI